ncbi:MAG TPA: nitronate monooxygenase [Jatrophihabitans sp.]|jgi:nitronate monooxygenase|uniref:nitronate monooxygenase n=1 Tax=Jatrophihabitans sp. TaxID=1932789 RepID=UPI002EE5AAE6
MGTFTLDTLPSPIVQAPMAGGPSTPALAAAVSGAGGLGFLAAGYKTVDAVRDELVQLRALLAEGLPFGVNVFAPPGPSADPARVAAYARTLRGEAERTGAALGEPRWDDDRYGEKLDLLCAEKVPVVSFVFGCPTPADVRRLHESGASVWVTVTTADEAGVAAAAGADALVVQGVEAGGHRGGFDDEMPGEVGLLALLQLVRRSVGSELALVAAGGIATGEAVAGVLAAGADAAQLGTAFLLCPEAATVAVHREALAHGVAPTALTRAFTGRTARGVVNRFLREHSSDAPTGYPEVHHLTQPLRVAARQHGDPDGVHLWAGQAYPLAEPLPAAEVVHLLVEAAGAALAQAAARLRGAASDPQAG